MRSIDSGRSIKRWIPYLFFPTTTKNASKLIDPSTNTFINYVLIPAKIIKKNNNPLKRSLYDHLFIQLIEIELTSPDNVRSCLLPGLSPVPRPSPSKPTHAPHSLPQTLAARQDNTVHKPLIIIIVKL